MKTRLLRRRGLTAVVLMSIVASTFAVGTEIAPTATVRAAAPPKVIELTNAGPSRTSVYVTTAPDSVVQWRNTSDLVLTVSSPSGLLDSGPIPPGGVFLAAFPVAGSVTWTTEVGGGTTVSVPDRLGTFEERDRPAVDLLVDTLAPPQRDGELTLHPSLARDTSQGRFEVGLEPDATASDVNALLSRTGTALIGASPRIGVITVGFETMPTTHVTVDRAVDLARTLDGVAFAIHDIPPSDANLPRPMIDLITSSPAPGKHAYTWSSSLDAPLGDQLNEHLESSRFPAVWNLRQAIDSSSNVRTSTVVLEVGGFEPHIDLDRLTELSFCRPRFVIGPLDRCTSVRGTDHANQTAGLIGADFDDDVDALGRSPGVVGADLYSNIYGLSISLDDIDTGQQVSRSAVPVLEMLLDEMLLDEDERRIVGDVRVINYSTSDGLDAAQWQRNWSGKLCGPGADDDDTGAEVCTPANEDGSLYQVHGAGEKLRKAVAEFTVLANPPLIIAAAGNDSSKLCPGLAATCNAGDHIVLPSEAMSSMVRAARTWHSTDGPNPIIVVGAAGDPGDDPNDNIDGTSHTRSPLSNDRVDISATGFALSSESSAGAVDARTAGCRQQTDAYCLGYGTSTAAPSVSAAAGTLLAWDPTLTTEELRDALLNWVRPVDLIDPIQQVPLLDAYASLTSLPGTTEALADINDPSTDGNRRVSYDVEGNVASIDTTQSLRPGDQTAPDGKVDIRDFRRFRDAWLATCLLTPEAGCPTDIVLDGDDDHPKKDLNHDGCVQWTAPLANRTTPVDCPSETIWNRFDLNGDGIVSRTATARVGRDPLGLPASGPKTAAMATDLDVLRWHWGTSTTPGDPATQGLTGADLDDLLQSGDLEIQLAGLDSTGADNASVEIDLIDDQRIATTFFTGTSSALDDVVATIPAGERFQVSVSATGPGGTISTSTEVLEPLASGEDRRIDVCGALALDIDPDVLHIGGETAEVVATVRTCGLPRDGIDLDLTLSPPLPNGPALSTSTVTTDDNGQATFTVTTGVDDTDFFLTAKGLVPIQGDGTSALVARRADVFIPLLGSYEPVTIAAGVGKPAEGDTVFGPSVASSGEVVFADEQFSADRILVASPLPSGPPAPPTVLDLPAGQGRLDTPPIANDNGNVAAIWETVGSAGPNVRTDSVVISPMDGSAHQVLTTVNDLAVTPGTADRFEELGFNNASQVVVVSSDDDAPDRITEVRLTGVAPNGDLVFGESLPNATIWLADDGSVGGTNWGVVADASGQQLETDPRWFVFSSLGISPIADLETGGMCSTSLTSCADGPGEFRRVSQGALSDDGVALAFRGEHNLFGSGLYVRLGDGAGTWTPALEVVGGGGRGTATELPGGGSFLEILDEPVGVVHSPHGAAGPLDDVVVLSFEAKPTAGGDLVDDRPGLFTVRAQVIADSDGDIALNVAVAEPVLQVGDTLDGGVVETIDTFDPIALASSPTGPADHHLAFAVRSTTGNSIVWAQPPDRLDLAPGDAILPAPGVQPAPFRGAHLTRPLRQAPMPSQRGAPQQNAPMAAADPVDAAGFPHFAAFTVSAFEPVTGSPLTITNRSRRADGDPSEAALAPILGLRRNATVLQPGESVQVVPIERGRHTVEIAAPLFDSPVASIAMIDLIVAVGLNEPPVVNLDDRSFPVGSGIEMTADASDPDRDSMTYAWDVDDDGTPDTIGGTRPTLTLSPEDTAANVCSGACVEGRLYPITVFVDDRSGGQGRATGTATFTSLADFGLGLVPGLAKISPGKSGRVFVDVDSIGGFVGTIDLSLADVPDDWSVTVSRNVDAGSSGTIDVRVPADTTLDQATIGIIGTWNGVERRVDLVVTTVFGLVPVCPAELRIAVSDPDGAPLGGVSIRIGLGRTVTGADGIASVSPTFREGAEFDQVGIRAERTDDFWAPPGRVVRFGCNETIDVPITMLPRRTGQFTGRIVEARYNPYGPPIPTDVPLEGATVAGFGYTTTSASDGRFEGSSVEESLDGPMQAPAFVSKDGYWQTNATELFGDDVDQIDIGDIPLLAKCVVHLGGGLVVNDAGDPVDDATVLGPDGSRTTTDATGRFDFGVDVDPDYNNKPQRYSFVAQSPRGPEWGSSVVRNSVLTALTGCDGTTPDVTIELQRVESFIDRLADVVGTVTDAATGQPIETRVLLERGGGTIDRVDTDAAGNYEFRDIVIGQTLPSATEPLVVDGYRVVAETPGYYDSLERFVLTSETELTRDLALVAERRSGVAGTVRDIETRVPIDAALVEIRGLGLSVLTDDSGRYEFDGIVIPPDTPLNVRVRASRLGDRGDESFYWASEEIVALDADGPTSLDLDLLRVCAGGDVSGVVVNASTLEPLDDVQISAGGLRTTTDIDGKFELIDVPVDPYNQPNEVILVAQKEGFFTASVEITVFCDSVTVVDFGRPSTEFGTITGRVTESADGAPIEGAFVGSQFGPSTTTDADGMYRFGRVPLDPDNSSRRWDITVIDDTRRSVAGVDVSASPDAVLDFVLDTPATTTTTLPTTTTTTTTLPTTTSTTTTTVPTTTTSTTTTTTSTTMPATTTPTTPPATTTTLAPSDGTTPTVIIDVDGEPFDGTRLVVSEGDTIMLDATRSLPGSTGPLSFEWTVSRTDAGGADAPPATPDVVTGPTLTLSPTDDSIYAVRLARVDSAESFERDIEIVVENVPPSVVLAGVGVPGSDSASTDLIAVVGEPVEIVYTVDDPGADTFELIRPTPPRPDGLSEITASLSGDRLTLLTTFDTAGPADIAVEVCDDDGGCGTWTGMIEVRPQVLPTPTTGPSTTAAPPTFDLPVTGSNVAVQRTWALGVLAVGLLLLLATRRRHA